MYAIKHDGKAIGPKGIITDTEGTPLNAEHADDYNKQLEAQEIEYIKTAPDSLFLYVHIPEALRPKLKIKGDWFGLDEGVQIRTWPGTPVSSRCWLGPRRQMGFGWNTYRRAVDCLIFGVRYTGWFMESSGDYCRLKKAKRQYEGAGVRNTHVR